MTWPSGSRLSGATAIRYDVTGTEDVTVWTGRTTPTSDAIPLIYCHGFGTSGTSTTWRDETLAGDDFRPIAAWGFPVIAANLAGASTWGNDASITAVDNIVSWANGAYGTRTDKVIVGGESMGALTALNWAWRNTDRVAAVWLRVPCTNLAALHDRSDVFRGAIEGAYGNVAAYEAALPTHDPTENTDLLRPLGKRTRIWLAVDDEIFPATEVRSFAGRVRCAYDQIPGVHADGYGTPAYVVALWLANTISLNP